MGAFFVKHQYLVVWVCGLAIVGALAMLIFQLNGVFVPTASVLIQPTAPSVPPPPPAPSVSLTIQTNGKSHTLLVQWNNLPAGTAALNIYRGTAAQPTSTWTLWKTVSLSGGNLASGNASFAISGSDLGYEYYLNAVGGGSDSGSTGGTDTNSSSTPILWSSDPTVPATSTPPTSGGNSGSNGSQNASSSAGNGNNASSTNASSTNPTANTTSTASSTGTNGGGSTGNSGTPYYNPHVQIAGYGAAPGSFWVEHVNQNIEVGWQNLPDNTDDIVFYRSTSQDGPWNQFLEQRDPGSTGSYSLQIVDGTVGQPFYYEMTASQGDAASATYGPIYLSPAGQ